jgi:hypothetical protein
MYLVKFGDRVEEFEARREALAHARHLSEGRRRRVHVEDAAGSEQLTYLDGDLEFAHTGIASPPRRDH